MSHAPRQPLPDAAPRPARFTSERPAQLCCMISGGGRTVLNLHDAILRGELPASIELVIASSEVEGVARCRARGMRVLVMPGVLAPDDLERTLRAHAIDWVVLAGYLKILRIPASYRGRVVNIHPALLPKFGGPGMYGRRVHEAVLRAGERVSGCTVHLCDDTFDTGPHVLQLTCPVFPDDTPDTLAARVFEAECRAYPRALRTLLEGHTPPETRADHATNA